MWKYFIAALNFCKASDIPNGSLFELCQNNTYLKYCSKTNELDWIKTKLQVTAQRGHAINITDELVFKDNKIPFETLLKDI